MKRAARLFFLVALLVAWANAALAASRFSVASGNWNQTAVWSAVSGGPPGASVPGAGDAVTIGNGHTVTVNVAASCASLAVAAGNADSTLAIGGANSLAVSGNATVTGNTNNRTKAIAVNAGTLSVGGSLTLSAGNSNRVALLTLGTGTATVGGNLSVNNAGAGVIFSGSGLLNIGGNFNSGGTLTRSTGTVAFNGAGAQSIGAYTYHHLTINKSAGTATLLGNASITGNLSDNGRFSPASGNRIVTFNGSAAQGILGTASGTTFYQLTLNNPAGLSIAHDITLTNRLTLSNGTLTTGANTVTIPNGSSVSRTGSTTSNFVAGKLKKYVPTGNNRTVTFEIGSATSYAPVTLLFSTVTGAGSVTASTASGEHPDIATSGINASKDVNRYWNLQNAGTVFTAAGYRATFTFVAAERDPGSNFASYIVKRYAAPSWFPTTVGTRAATSIQALGLTAFGGFAAGEPGSTVDHFLISHGGTGVTCQAEPVTITAHDAAHNPMIFSGTMGLGTSTGHGDWSLLSGSGAFSNSGNGVGSYTFNNESSVVLGLKDTYAETTNINVASGVATENSGTSVAGHDPNLVFAESGFRFIDALGSETIATQTAGQTSPPHYLQAIRTDTRTGACVGAFGAGQTVSINLASQCNNPTTCAGTAVNFTNNGTTTALASNPNAGVASYTSVAVKFLNDSTSRAAFTFNYPDVGAITLHARYNIPLGSGGASTNFMIGASNPFVVKPYSFVLSNIKRSSDGFANPAAANAAGAAFIKAGAAFTATVTASAFGGAATPNFGREAMPEGVLLTGALVLPAGGNNPALSGNIVAGSEFGAGGMVADANGVATVTNLSWGEAGIITLTPSVADGDYLGTGNVTGAASGNIGRFYPDHFVLSLPVLTNRSTSACAPASIFTYMGEPMRLDFTLTAQNAAGGTTQNYATANGFAKLDPSVAAPPAPQGFNFGAVNAGTRLTPRLDLSLLPTATWVNGVINVSKTLAFNRAASPDGPFEALDLGIAPQDSDAVQVAPAALDLDVDLPAGNDHAKLGQTRVRYGRLKMDNALGSELLALPVPLTAQYFSGSGFATNSADSCTQVPVPTSGNGGLIFAAQTAKNQLAAGETTASINGATTGNGTFTGGNGGLRLTAPGQGNFGYVDLAIPAPAWLQFNWTGTVGDPRARATFGVYKNANQFIYMRENY